jgi:dimethylhistidine N-methyltransferase
VSKGLNSTPKFLPSKYLYDQKGDALFQQIMELEEYYLTRTEYIILEQNAAYIRERFIRDCTLFNLIEFGAGDATKTRLLLKEFLSQGTAFNYIPVDISASVLEHAERALQSEFHRLKVSSFQGDYFAALDLLKYSNREKNVVLFLGSNIGNFTEEEAGYFIEGISARLKPGDLLLLGVDLKKDPATIIRAYNDKEGVTAAFNKNLLVRINKELDADFDTSTFYHYPIYDPHSGEAKSYLVSTIMQKILLKKLDCEISFEKGEPIFMERSRKYTIAELDALAMKQKFRIIENMTDKHR